MGQPLSYDGGQETQGMTFDQFNDNNQQTGGHPAWQEILNEVPQELHEKLTPKLQEWDKGVQQKIQRVHSDYEPYKPILSQGYAPEDLETAVKIYNAIQTDPRMVYDSLGTHYQFATESNNQQGSSSTGQGQTEPTGEEDPYAAQFQKYDEQMSLMAQAIIAQREKEAEEQADVELDQELSGLKQQFGDFDESYVLAKMYAGMSGEDAAKEYIGMVQRISQGTMPKPLIMGAGGGLPNQQTDIKKASDKDVNSLVVQMLQADQQQNQ